jgi:hypothetical protein
MAEMRALENVILIAEEKYAVHAKTAHEEIEAFNSQYEAQLETVRASLEIVLNQAHFDFLFDTKKYRFLNKELIELFENLRTYPSLIFGVEVALLDFFSTDKRFLYSNEFCDSIIRFNSFDFESILD